MDLLVATTLILVAHTTGLSGGAYVVADGTLKARLSFHKEDLGLLLAARGEALGPALAIEISRAGRACPPEAFNTSPEEPDGIRVTFEARCNFVPGEVVGLELGFLEHLPSGHRHFYEANGGGALFDGVAYQGASKIQMSVATAAAEAPRPWLVWAMPIWLLFGALGLGAGTRRRALEVFVAAVFSSLMLVGVGAATELRPSASYLGFAAPIFAFYLAAELYLLRAAPRRVALALPAGLIAAFLLLAHGLPVGAAEDRVALGLTRFIGLGLAPAGLALALTSLGSLRWPRVASALVGLASVALLTYTVT